MPSEVLVDFTAGCIGGEHVKGCVMVLETVGNSLKHFIEKIQSCLKIALDF